MACFVGEFKVEQLGFGAIVVQRHELKLLDFGRGGRQYLEFRNGDFVYDFGFWVYDGRGGAKQIGVHQSQFEDWQQLRIGMVYEQQFVVEFDGLVRDQRDGALVTRDGIALGLHQLACEQYDRDKFEHGAMVLLLWVRRTARKISKIFGNNKTGAENELRVLPT